MVTKKTSLPRIERKSLLNVSKVEYADYAINHVEGCSHGCLYPCYAMMQSHRNGTTKDYPDWIKPKLIGNALELLEKEIPKKKDKIKFVHLCFTTDPFMYKQPEVEDLTLKIIARLNKDNIRCTTLTKGIYPNDLTDKKLYGENNEYGITLVSIDEAFRKRFEPNTATFENRVEGLRKLHEAGLKTWVSMEPYPTPNIVDQDLGAILSKLSFVDKIIFGRWNYSGLVSSYVGVDQFFNDCADIVVSFCEKNKIDYHIKNKTRRVTK